VGYKVGLDVDDKGSAKIKKFGADATSVFKGVTAAAGLQKGLEIGLQAISSGFDYVRDSVQHVIDTGSKWKDMSEKFGVSAEALSSLGYAAETTGADIDTIGRAMQFAAKSADTGSKAFDELGVSTRNADGTIKNSEQLFLDTADAISGVASDTEKVRLAQEAWGKGGADLIPMLKGGADSIRDLQEEARRLGIVYTDDMANSADAAGDAQLRFNKALEGIKTQVVLQALPKITDLFEDLSVWLSSNKDLVSALGGMFTKFAGGVVAAAEVVTGVSQKHVDIIEGLGHSGSDAMDDFIAYLDFTNNKLFEVADSQISFLQTQNMTLASLRDDSFDDAKEVWQKEYDEYLKWKKKEELADQAAVVARRAAEEEKRKATAEENKKAAEENKKAAEEAARTESDRRRAFDEEQKKLAGERQAAADLEFENKIAMMTNEFEIERAQVMAEYVKRAEDENANEEYRNAAYDAYTIKREDIAAREAAFIKNLEQEKQDAFFGTVSTYGRSLSGLLAATKASANMQKGVALGIATVEGFGAMIKAINSAPPPANIPAILLTGMQVATNIAGIKNTSFHSGGDIAGYNGQERSITAIAGEAIIDARTSSQAGGHDGIMDAIRQRDNTAARNAVINITIMGGLVDAGFVRNDLIPVINAEMERTKW